MSARRFQIGAQVARLTLVRERPRSKAKQPPVRAGSRWTHREDAWLAYRFGRGLRIEDIAEVHQRSPSAVRSELQHLGLFARYDLEAVPDPVNPDACRD